MQIRIEDHNLPGLACAGSAGFPGYENIHVAVQGRAPKRELLGLTAADATSATWTLECDVTRTPTGFDFKGAEIQGRPHERFIYLTWGSVDRAGTFEMFRRAKLWLDVIDAGTVAAALESGRIVGRIGLTDAKGHPLCASVRPPVIEWSAAPS